MSAEGQGAVLPPARLSGRMAGERLGSHALQKLLEAPAWG